MPSNSNDNEVTQRRNQAQEPVLVVDGADSHLPDISSILQRSDSFPTFDSVVATSFGPPTAHRSNAQPHTPTSSSITTRSNLSSVFRHRRQTSSSTAPTSIYPPSSPLKKPTVQVQEPAERPPSRDSIQAIAGSDTDSSSDNKPTKEKERVDYVWAHTTHGMGSHLPVKESASAQKRSRKAKYEVVVDQAPPETQLNNSELKLLLKHSERSNWVQIVQMSLTSAVLVVLIGIWLKSSH